MDHGVRKLRSQVSRVTQGKPPTAVRYPAGLRGQVLAMARRRRAQGAGVARIAREVGVAPQTLALWLRSRRRRVLRVVDVAPDPPSVAAGPRPSPVLVTPQGFRIEGADLSTLVTLLRALA